MTAAAGFSVVILAAGQGTRMRSRRPKMLHEAAGRPLLEHVLRAVLPLAPQRTVLVVGHGADEIRERFRSFPVEFVTQERQLGTGHALASALPALDDLRGDVMVLTGDCPLVTSETLATLHDAHARRGEGLTLLSYRVADPTGLGRIVRDRHGEVASIVEEKDASDAERRIDEISPGLFLFDRRVFDLISRLGNDNAQGEYYLTDLPALYLGEGLPVQAVEGHDETGRLVGVNDRAQLAEAERILRERVRRRWLAEGVTMMAPEFTFVDDTVEMERDVLLEPGVILRGGARLGEGVRIGAYAVLDGVEVPAGVSVPPHSVWAADAPEGTSSDGVGRETGG